jgi:subtilisin family serine protease
VLDRAARLTHAAAGVTSDGPVATDGSKEVPRAEFVPGSVLVRFRPGTALAARTAQKRAALTVRSTGGRQIPAEVREADGLEIVEGLRVAHVAPGDTLEAVEAFKARADVLYAEPDYVWRKTQAPNDPSFGSQYALPKISAPQAWDRTTGSSNVVVVVMDGGVDISHPDLAANIWKNPGEVPANGVDDDGDGFIDDVSGWDFHHNDNSVFDGEDGDDHGTHVAGTIGARGNNGLGVTGVNWQVGLLPVKVLGPQGGSTSNIIKGYNYVRMLRGRGVNVRVINNSYGGGGMSQAARDAISQLNDAGILFVAAAGNESQDNFSFPHYPSDYELPNIISVASTTSSDTVSSFSNTSPRVVTMGAPGSGILSTIPPSMAAGLGLPAGTAYASYSGTSMATPHVSGAAALVLSVNPGLSVQNLRGVLAYSGDSISSLDGRSTTGRRLNVSAAVNSALESAGSVDPTPPAPVGNLEVLQQFGRQVNLRWTAPGDDGNSGTVSDYDIFFIYPATGARLLLPVSGGFSSPLPAGSLQSSVVNLPYRNFSGTVEVRAYDNAGNFSSTTIPVTVQRDVRSDPYVVTESAPEPLSSGGTALGIVGDDKFRESVQLPFSFPFFGEHWGYVNVSSNGALYFHQIPQTTNSNGNPTGLDAGGSLVGLRGQSMIAGLWDDLRTDRGGDVYMVQPDANHVIFRWQAVTFDTPLAGGMTRGEQPVNFEIELRSDGTITTRYGTGQSAPTNTQLFPVVGISGGEPDAYPVASHISESARASLTNAGTVRFSPNIPVPTPTPTPTPVPSPTPLQYVDLSGRVVENGQGLPGVSVSLGISGVWVQQATTDANGRYAFTGAIVSGNYYIQFTKSGYSFNPATLNFVASQPNLADVTATKVSPVDVTDFFVRQHYADFLNRQPDASGLQFWTNNIESCGMNAGCRDAKRVDTSAAFFLSIEFQETGYLVYRFYKAAYGDLPGRPVPVARADFLPDTQSIGNGVVVNQGEWRTQLENNKQAFALAFVQRAAFQNAYPSSLTADDFVAKLDRNAGGVLSVDEKAQLVSALGSTPSDASNRAAVLRRVAENANLYRGELNKAFVLMQYFGYLQRNPNDLPDADFSGYNFWLSKLEQFGGDFRRAEMVRAFITSDEYRRRFGQ